MKQKNIILTIDGKIHKLMDYCESCDKCSLYYFCGLQIPCPAFALGGAFFLN